MKADRDEIFQMIRRERNGVASIHSAFKDFPQGVAAHYQLYKQIVLMDDLPLPRAEREFLAVKTSEANMCPYCIGHHQSALDNLASAPTDLNRANALNFLAETLTKAMWKTSPLKRTFLDAGFTEAEWQHAVMIVAYFNFANRCVHAMGLELEEDFETTCG